MLGVLRISTFDSANMVPAERPTHSAGDCSATASPAAAATASWLPPASAHSISPYPVPDSRSPSNHRANNIVHIGDR